jgi:hypothetical protein
LDPASAGFDRVWVWVDRRTWLIRQVRFSAPGLRVKVRFDGIQAYSREDLAKDPSLDPPDSQFECKAPKDFEVFDSLLP